MEKRMNGSDYRLELNVLRVKQKSLEVHISARVSQLVKSYPNAIIERIHNTDIKASSLNKSYLDAQSVEKKIHYIEVIEKWLADQSKVKQGNLFA
jgi:hypothetical protein